MKTKNFFQKKHDKISDKTKILIGSISSIGFLTISVFALNIFQNPILNNSENFLEEAKNFHGSAENFYFSGKEKIQKNFYLINFVGEISKIYEENGKVSYGNPQEKELFLRKVAREYTMKNIEEFRKNSTAEENVEQFSWRLLNKTLPVGFEVDMGELEEIFVENLKK